VAAECRLDFLTEAAQMIRPAQPQNAPGEAHLDNPRLQRAAQEAPLSPAQRAALLPHWHSFLNESLFLRQELRATLAAISSDPAALGFSLAEASSAHAAAQVSARPPLTPHSPSRGAVSSPPCCCCTADSP
jgi:hypothetical protein